MMKILLLSVLVCILSACAPSADQIATPLAATLDAVPTQTAYPTLTAWPTYTPNPAYTPNPTYTPVPTLPPIVITATSSPTPEFTPTETNTPEPTKDKIQLEKDSGFYLIGEDIAVGIWRSNGSGESCYWEVTTKTGDIVSNHFGMSGGTAYIPANGYQVRFEDCGTCTYLGQ